MGTADGKTADITLSRSGDGTARYLVTGDGIYLQGDKKFWERQKAPAKVLEATGKFIKMPSGSQAVTESLTLKPFLSKIFDALNAESLAPGVTMQSLNGVECWVITDAKGRSEGALYVSKADFEVVRFTGSSKSPDQLDFSRWNEDLSITAPAAADVQSIG